MHKITKQNDHLIVPDKVTIPFIEGDGVGAEITPVSQKIVNAAIEKAYGGRRAIEWKEVLAGEKAFNKTGSWLPDETMDAFREYMVGIKGPLTTPIGGGIRSLNVALRQTLDLYVCLRPVRWFKGVVSPVREPQKVDMYIFRENTEDIYAGIEWQQGTPEARKFLKFLTEEMGVTKVRFPETSSFGVKPVSVEGTERLAAAALLHLNQCAQKILGQSEGTVDDRTGQERPVGISALIHHGDALVDVLGVEQVDVDIIDRVPVKHTLTSLSFFAVCLSL